MNEQKSTSMPQRPTTDDDKAWRAYWEAQNQPWRTDPEIDTQQQRFLEERRGITPQFDRGIYPFGGIKLTRADVEWLLATHENGLGPVHWTRTDQGKRKGIDLRGADLRNLDLSLLPLTCMIGGLRREEWLRATVEQREAAIVHMEKSHLQGTHLEGARLREAHFNEAFLREAHLEQAYLRYAHFEGAYLKYAHLEDADLGGAFFDSATRLNNVILSDKEKKHTAQMSDIHWGEANLAVVNWSQVEKIGDEYEVYEMVKKDRDKKNLSRQRSDASDEGGDEEEGEGPLKKGKDKYLSKFRKIARAYRQLAAVLQSQGMSETAKRFSYRAERVQRVAYWRERTLRGYLAWFFSWLLDWFAGYGYKPVLFIRAYVIIVLVFALLHYVLGIGEHLTPLSALAISIQALHSRTFTLEASDPQTLLNTTEAFVGLFVEAILIGIITQRILGK